MRSVTGASIFRPKKREGSRFPWLIIFVGIWILLQLLQGTAELLTPTAGAGIAWWAHVGGFVAGAVLGSLLFLPKRERRPYYADEGFLGFDPAGRP